jgi:hypothetical protein
VERTYDIFECFAYGVFVWRAAVTGKTEAESKLTELAQNSKNEFLAIDIPSRDSWISPI